MVNNTVKTGNAAGIADKTIITFAEVKQKGKELEAKLNGKKALTFDDFISIKAYEGGNPKRNRDSEGITH